MESFLDCNASEFDMCKTPNPHLTYRDREKCVSYHANCETTSAVHHHRQHHAPPKGRVVSKSHVVSTGSTKPNPQVPPVIPTETAPLANISSHTPVSKPFHYESAHHDEIQKKLSKDEEKEDEDDIHHHTKISFWWPIFIVGMLGLSLVAFSALRKFLYTIQAKSHYKGSRVNPMDDFINIQTSYAHRYKIPTGPPVLHDEDSMTEDDPEMTEDDPEIS